MSAEKFGHEFVPSLDDADRCGMRVPGTARYPAPSTQQCWGLAADHRRAPEQADVDALRGLLDLMADFPSNDQRARYLLSCNWMRDREQCIFERGAAHVMGGLSGGAE